MKSIAYYIQVMVKTCLHSYMAMIACAKAYMPTPTIWMPILSYINQKFGLTFKSPCVEWGSGA